jgi:hypothetical protein
MTSDEWQLWTERHQETASRGADQGYGSVMDFIAQSSDQLPDDAKPHAWQESAAMLKMSADGRLRTRADPHVLKSNRADVGSSIASVGRYAGPVLLLTAARFDAVSPAGIEALRAQMAENLIVSQLDSGHALMWCQFQETAAKINAFLASR